MVYSLNNEILTNYEFQITMNESYVPKNDCKSDDFFQGGHWRALSSHKLPAKWILDGGYDKITDFQNKVTEDFIDQLIFEPFNCRIKNLNDLFKCEQIKSSESLCFVGDSQMRHLHAMIQSIFVHDTTAFVAPTNHTTDKTVVRTGPRHFVEDPWAEIKINGELCDSIFIGFGQWQLSGARKVDNFSPQDYAELVNQTLWTYVNRFPKPKLYFVGTFPLGQNSRLYSKPPIDFRNDVVLRDINAAGMKACNHVKHAVGFKRLSCMNLFEMANVVRDLSYDLAHFKAPVGLQMALAVMTQFCNE